MPTARPMMPSSDRLVSNTRASPNFSCSPSVAPCTPPLRPTSSPNTTTLRIDRQLDVPSVRRIAVTMLMRGPSERGVSVAVGSVTPALSRPPCCCRSTLPSVVRSRRTHGASCASHRERCSLRPRPVQLAHRRAPAAPSAFHACSDITLRHQLRAQLNQRIASALGGDLIGRLVRLRVLTRVPGQTRHQHAQQHRTFAGAHGVHGLCDQLPPLRPAWRCRLR